jgi:hypothetical protein
MDGHDDSPLLGRVVGELPDIFRREVMPLLVGSGGYCSLTHPPLCSVCCSPKKPPTAVFRILAKPPTAVFRIALYSPNHPQLCFVYTRQTTHSCVSYIARQNTHSCVSSGDHISECGIGYRFTGESRVQNTLCDVAGSGIVFRAVWLATP